MIPLDLEKIQTISELLEAFNRTSFQSRTLARCANILVAMLEDPKRPTVFFGLAGAMVPAGMKGVVSTMVRRNMIDVIVSTGANMYHDLVEALGEHHYLGSPDMDDRILREESIDRIYDTYADETKFRMIDNRIMLLADQLAEQNIDTFSSRFFLNQLGDFIDKEGKVEDKKDSIIWNCWRDEVPIFVPALNDSSLGLALTQHHIKFVEKKKNPFVIDQIKDNYEIFSIKRMAPKTGVIYIGGGVPKNYIQQTAYLQDLFGIPDASHDYGFQITTDSPHWGGLSGCTFMEGISWGKEKVGGNYATCYCDATIALPLIVKTTLERSKKLEKRSKLRLKF
ncbi:deoxyhypusine synthase family protein [Candidatus Bathyarchaeota archaeon]|nr:deoxyhypusine synthase family protein [Candidatus Bathyarchaeota archaeon]